MIDLIEVSQEGTHEITEVPVGDAPEIVEVSTSRAGRAATITIGTVTTGSPGSDANVTNSGTAGEAVLDFTIPTGNTVELRISGGYIQWKTAEAETWNNLIEIADITATIGIGTVTTGDPGTDVLVANSGAGKDAVFNFAIPQGIKGVSMRIRGAWASGASYVNDATYIDIVTLNGSSYACKLSHTSAEANIPPDATNWELLSEKGDWGTMTVGTVTTGAAGSDVVITNVGTDTDAVLDITIPIGSTFTPSVSAEGVLSWTNDGGLSNPENKSLFPTGALARQVMVSDGLGGVTWQYIGDMAIKGGI